MKLGKHTPTHALDASCRISRKRDSFTLTGRRWDFRSWKDRHRRRTRRVTQRGVIRNIPLVDCLRYTHKAFVEESGRVAAATHDVHLVDRSLWRVHRGHSLTEPGSDDRIRYVCGASHVHILAHSA